MSCINGCGNIEILKLNSRQGPVFVKTGKDFEVFFGGTVDGQEGNLENKEREHTDVKDGRSECKN